MAAIEGIDKLFNRLNRIGRNLSQVEKPLKASGVYMLGSIERNFKAGGRPQRWKALAASTVKRRRRGKGQGGIKTLVDTATMKNSHSMRVQTDGVVIGTNAVQAKRQHFGYPGKPGRGHSRTPARPFVMIQDEDVDAVGQIFSRHTRS